MKLQITACIARVWCFITRGTPVYVKTNWRNPAGVGWTSRIVRVKVARMSGFDPFNNDRYLIVKHDKSTFALLEDGAMTGTHEGGQWAYVNIGKRVEMSLKKPIP